MKLVFSSIALCAFSMAFTSCGNNGGSSNGIGQQMGIGPFDSRGNYVEELADSPSKWRKPRSASASSSRSDSPAEIAKNEQPPMNSIPLAPDSSFASSTSSSSSRIAVKSIAETKVSERISTTPSSSSRKKTESEPVIAKKSTKAKPEPERESTTAKTKSKPTSKTKTKPKASRYVVKSGDSLSSIASRNGTSVSALKSENGISGAMIHPGQSLTIPRK